MQQFYNECEIFVAGFHPFTTEKDIHDLFLDCGTILSIRIKKNKGKPPYCIVEFSNQEEAELSIEKYNHTNLNSRFLTVRKANSKYNSTAKKTVYPFLRLMIKPCPPSISNENELQKFLMPYLIDLPIYFFKDENGIPIVIFNLKDQIDDKALILTRNVNDYQSQQIFVEKSIYKIPNRLNFHGFLSTTCYKEALDFFSELGEVFHLTLFDNKNGFIVFNYPIESQKCWEHFENQMKTYKDAIISISISGGIYLD
jgi:RNA recognition motif-containing protein